MPPWEFAREGEVIRVDPPATLVANLNALEIEAAAAGLGVVHTFDGFLAPALAAGALEPVLEDWSERFSGPFLYYAGRRHLPPPLATFIAFLRSPDALWPGAPAWKPNSRATDP
jgi:DNA-binding transcriptional LysR family regulator